jgi:hypothetical protein
MMVITALPFVEHCVVVREYDRACLLYLHGDPMKLAGSGYERIHPGRSVGPWKESEFEAVPVVLVARKAASDE